MRWVSGRHRFGSRVSAPARRNVDPDWGSDAVFTDGPLSVDLSVLRVGLCSVDRKVDLSVDLSVDLPVDWSVDFSVDFSVDRNADGNVDGNVDLTVDGNVVVALVGAFASPQLTPTTIPPVPTLAPRARPEIAALSLAPSRVPAPSAPCSGKRQPAPRRHASCPTAWQ